MIGAQTSGVCVVRVLDAFERARLPGALNSEHDHAFGLGIAHHLIHRFHSGVRARQDASRRVKTRRDCLFQSAPAMAGARSPEPSPRSAAPRTAPHRVVARFRLCFALLVTFAPRSSIAPPCPRGRPSSAGRRRATSVPARDDRALGLSDARRGGIDFIARA